MSRLSTTLSTTCLCLTLSGGLLAGDDVNEAINAQLDNAPAARGFVKGQFVAVPIPMASPTLGNGLQLALLYLHPKKEGADETAPNATSGVGGMKTDTDSVVAGLFHDGYLFDDRLRLRGGIAKSDVNIDFFGSNIIPDALDFGITYNLKADIAMVQGLMRLQQSNWYGGLRYLSMNAEVAFDFKNSPDFFFLIDLDDVDVSNLALVGEFDSRDSNYYPTSGAYFEASLARDDEAIGSDYNFTRLTTSYNYYFPLGENNVIASRLHADQVIGTSPFFLLPSLNMWGFGLGRYQDQAALSAHLEWRYKFRPRWGLIMGAEVGRVGDGLDNLNGSDTITGYGVGLRWQVSAEQAMHLGLDAGFSGDESAIYLHIGERF